MAPRHTKSWLTSVFWPTWHWSRWPSTQFLFAAYSMNFAIRDAVASRRLMDDRWYQERWGCSCNEKPHADWCESFRWTTDQNVKQFYENDRGGRRLTAGVEAGTTGQGADILVGDDLIDIQKADSDATRKATNHYVDQVFLGRMNDPGRSRVVCIAQRTHQDDPTGHLLAESSLPWVHLKIPTEYRRKAMVDLGSNPLGWKDPRTEEGELLWPSRFTRQIVEDKKVTLGPYGYASKEMQDPSPLEGGIIKRQWWRFWIPAGLPDRTAEERALKELLLRPVQSKEGIIYPVAEVLPVFKTASEGGDDEIILSLDASFKDEAAQIRKGNPPDPISCGAWGRRGPRCYLLERVNERADIERTIGVLVGMIERYPQAVRKVIEDKANGPAIMALLRRRVGGLTPATPTSGKVARVMTAGGTEKDTDARAMSMVALLAAGNVFLPHPLVAPWVWAYIEEHGNFPNGTNDDDVDMTSQALTALQPWIWRLQDKDQSEVLSHGLLPVITDTREILRRRVYAASGIPAARAAQPTNGGPHPPNGRLPRKPFVDPYRRNGR